MVSLDPPEIKSEGHAITTILSGIFPISFSEFQNVGYCAFKRNSYGTGPANLVLFVEMNTSAEFRVVLKGQELIRVDGAPDGVSKHQFVMPEVDGLLEFQAKKTGGGTDPVLYAVSMEFPK